MQDVARFSRFYQAGQRRDSWVFIEEPYEPVYKTKTILEFFVFLPFNGVWEFVLIVFLIACYFLSTCILPYGKVPAGREIFLCASCLILIDVITTVMHRTYVSISEMREFKKIPVYFIILDSILIIPVEYIFSEAPSGHSFLLIVLVDALRVIRLVRYYVKGQNSIAWSSLFFLVLKIIAISSILIQSFSVVWFYLGWREGVLRNNGWIIALEDSSTIPGPGANEKDISYWYLLSIYFVTSAFTKVGFGDLVGTNTTERVLSVIIVFVGYGSLTIIFIINFTSQLTQRYKHNSEFNSRLRLIKKSVENSRLKANVEQFYQRFWQERRAIAEPAIMKVLPTTVREDVYFDIFKYPLQKCYIFDGLPPSILKKISGLMRFSYYLPGDMVVERNVVTSTMIYISLGVVEVLTDEDDESPVFAMTCGTILNSSHLILIRPAKTNIKAVKYTITYELQSCDLFMLLKDYPAYISRVMANHKEFLTYIKKVDRVLKNRQKTGQTNIQKLFNQMKYSYGSDWDMMEKPEFEEGHNMRGTRVHLSEDSDFEGLMEKSKAVELYVASQERVELVIDDACVNTIFPWVLEPSSHFVSFWQAIVFVISLLAGFIVPLNAAFSESNLKWMSVLLAIIDSVVVIDLVLSLMTAQEVPGGRISTNGGIVRRRFQDPWFYVDLFTALPLHMFFGTDMKNNTIFRINILFNFRKINAFLVKMQNKYMLNLTISSIIKYVTFFFLAAVWLGSFFYIITCFPVNVCKEKSWLTRIEQIDESYSPPQVRYKYQLTLSIYWGVQMISETSLADILGTTGAEYIVICIYCIVGELIFCYLVADYSSTLTLSQSSRIAFRDFFASILNKMKKNNIPESLQTRAVSYLETLWLYNEGYQVLHDGTLMWDAPKHLIKDLKIEKCYKSLMKIPFISTVSNMFRRLDCDPVDSTVAQDEDGVQAAKHVLQEQEAGDDENRWNMNVILDLCSLTDTIIVPPNEIIIHSGQKCRKVYILENGVCQLINSQGQVVKTLVKSDNINSFELFLRKHSLNNAKTLTHCLLICVKEESIKHVLASNLEDRYIHDCEKIIEKVLKSPYTSSLFASYVTPPTVLETVQTRHPNFYSFSTGFRNKPNIEYLQPFLQLGIFGTLGKLFLMSRTISPGSQFHIMWETGRAVCAFLSCLLFPHLTNLTLVLPFLLYIAVTLDLLAVVDMYIQMHMCYLNDDKLLISHPLKTMTHYIKTGFILDLIAVLPINYFIPVEHYPPLGDGIEWIRVSYPFADFIRMNRILQIWRFFAFFTSLENRLLKKGQTLIFAKYFLLILVFLNTVSAGIISNTLVFLSHENEFKMYTPTSYKPWILMFKPDLKVTDLKEMLSMHVYAFYFASEISMSAGLGDLMPQDRAEITFIIIAIAISYLFFNYILVIVSNMRAALDREVAVYQDQMRHFLHFIESEKISPSLTRKLVEHFEFVWSHTRGTKLSDSFGYFHETLQGDCLMNLYKNVLLKTSLFRGMPEVLLRDIAILLEEKYFYSGTKIVQKNDIIDYILILYEGKVCVVDSLDVAKRPLDRGSIFGNFDDSPRVRIALSLLAKTHATLLMLKSAKLYELAKNYPLMLKRLELTVLQNRVYVRSSSLNESEEIMLVESPIFVNRIMSLMTPGETSYIIYTGFMTMLGIFSIYLHIYGVSFHVNRLFVYFFIMDILFALEIALNFVTPYEAPSTGEIIKDPRLIRKRYMSSGFIKDVVTTIPVYLLCYIFPYKYQYDIGSLLATNRLLRISELYKLLNASLNKLNVNVILLKSFTIAYTSILLAHIATSTWHIIRCTIYSTVGDSMEVKCMNEMNGQTKTVCDDNTYMCSLYYVLIILTGTGFGDIVPANVPQFIIQSLMIIMSRFILAIFLGDIINAAQCIHQRFLDFSFDYVILSSYLKMNNVSRMVENEVLSYAKTLWSTRKGVQVSEFLPSTPQQLKEELFLEMYGHHFKSNFLFVGCQDDFHRQFLIHVKSTIYQPGNIITYEGIIDDTCYVVHQGSVDVYSKGNIYVETLGENSFFGLGLFERTPHKYIYRVKVVSVILSLNFQEWKYLLDFFPSSKNEIYYRADVLGINPKKKIGVIKRKKFPSPPLVLT